MIIRRECQTYYIQITLIFLFSTLNANQPKMINANESLTPNYRTFGVQYVSVSSFNWQNCHPISAHIEHAIQFFLSSFHLNQTRNAEWLSLWAFDKIRIYYICETMTMEPECMRSYESRHCHSIIIIISLLCAF